jgi:membrane associated rhomboid family serine protease
MIIYSILGIIFGVLIIFITRKISSKALKYLAGIGLFFFFSVIASSILYGDMVKRANSLIRIRQEIGLNVNYDRFVRDRITKWNGTIYSGEIIGMIAAYLYFRKKRKDEAKKQSE